MAECETANLHKCYFGFPCNVAGVLYIVLFVKQTKCYGRRTKSRSYFFCCKWQSEILTDLHQFSSPEPDFGSDTENFLACGETDVLKTWNWRKALKPNCPQEEQSQKEHLEKHGSSTHTCSWKSIWMWFTTRTKGFSTLWENNTY